MLGLARDAGNRNHLCSCTTHFWAEKASELGKTLGKAGQFKKASNELKQTWEDEVRMDKEKEAMAEIFKDSTVTTSEVLGDVNDPSGSKEN